MTDPPFRERRVPPEEVRRILKRATALELARPEQEFGGKALTVAELEERLHALGISSEVARQAMAERPTESPATEDDGAIRVERIVQIDGMVSPDSFESIAETISMNMKIPGRVSAVGNTLTWTPPGALLEPAVTVSAKDGVTTLRYVETLAERGQMTVGFGTLSAFAGGMAGALGTVAGVAIAQAADLSRASGLPVVMGVAALVGIGAAIGSFVGLRRAIRRRQITRGEFADQVLLEVERAVRESLQSHERRVRIDAGASDVAAEAAEAAEAEAADAVEVEPLAGRGRGRPS